MSLYSGISRYNHLSEFNEPLDMGDGRVLSAATRRALALANLWGGSSNAVDFAGPTGTGADSAGVLTFNTAETTIVVTDQLGRIEFKAGSEASGTDAILTGAAIWAEAEDTFSSTVNATSIVFATGASEAAAEKVRIDSQGVIRPLAYRSPVVVIADDTTYAVLAANSGKLHVVPDVTSSITVTLPAAAAGLRYEFMYGGAAADAQNHIFVPTAGFYIGGVTFHDSQADATTAVFSDGNSNDVFTLVTPAQYTLCFVSDGTNWYVNGNVQSATVCTMAD